MLEETCYEQLKHPLTEIHLQLFYLFRPQPTLTAHPQSYSQFKSGIPISLNNILSLHSEGKSTHLTAGVQEAPVCEVQQYPPGLTVATNNPWYSAITSIPKARDSNS